MSAAQTILYTRDVPTRFLGLAALTSVYTLGQGLRFAGWCASSVEAKAELNRLIAAGLLGLCAVTLPRNMSGKCVQVIYLTEGGRKKILSEVSGLEEMVVSAGAPSGRNLARVPHELTATEALLYLTERYEVLTFQNERTIRRHLVSPRDPVAQSEMNFRLGDFRVLIWPEGAQYPQWLECEAEVDYTVAQIQAKPRGMIWFTTSKREWELLSLYAGGKVIALDDVGRIRNHRAEQAGKSSDTLKVNRLLNESRRLRVLEILKRFPGGMTAHAVAALVGHRRDHTSAVLSDLVRNREAVRYETHLIPGKQMGRPMALFAHSQDINQSEDLSLYDKINALMRSHLISNLCLNEYQISDFDPAIGLFTVKPGKRHRSLMYIVCDNTMISVESFAEQIIQLCKYRENLTVIFAHKNRRNKFAELQPEVRIGWIISQQKASLPDVKSVEEPYLKL